MRRMLALLNRDHYLDFWISEMHRQDMYVWYCQWYSSGLGTYSFKLPLFPKVLASKSNDIEMCIADTSGISIGHTSAT